MTDNADIATLDRPEVASVAKQRTIGIRKTSDGSVAVGTITRIATDDATESNPKPVTATVEVRHGPKPKPRKGGGCCDGPPWPKESHVYVPVATARELKVGQKVRIVFEPA